MFASKINNFLTFEFFFISRKNVREKKSKKNQAFFTFFKKFIFKEGGKFINFVQIVCHCACMLATNPIGFPDNLSGVSKFTGEI